jgi:hypothetical protein
MAPHGVYPTQQPDRWLTLAVRNNTEWHALVRELDQPAASSDPRFAAAEARLRHTPSYHDPGFFPRSTSQEMLGAICTSANAREPRVC